MFELSLYGVKKFMDATLVMKDITFQVYAGEKVGIVGENGSGKSTILKLIAGVIPMNYYPGYPQTSSYGYDEGFINLPRGASIAYLEQIPEYGEGVKVIDVLNMAFEEVHKIEAHMRELEERMKALNGEELEKALKQYSDMLELFEIKGGYEVEEKLSKVCEGLKLHDSFLKKDFSLLSGGEKTTVVLGKLLIDNPDILLLDEPTNHLDMDSIEWLEGYLNSYKGIVIMVSHDRYFMDNVVNKIVEIEDLEAKTYRGNYTSYVNQKEENLRVQYEQFREQQKKINAMERTVKDLRDWAMRADNNKFFRRATSLQIKLDKLERIEKPVFEKQNMKLNLKASNRSGNETIKAEGLSKSYEDKVIFKSGNMLVSFGERVALIGSNGCGKTTFLKLLLGEELPDEGTVEMGASVKAAYLPQRITFRDEELTILECFREDVLIVEGKAREYLSKYMFFGNTVFKKVKFLSGGEKIRLKLAKLLFEDVNLLILDEPTNHLDIDSIETFEEALEEFTGTIFFISHDRYFINNIAERVIAVEGRGFRSYDGNYDYYKSVRDAKRENQVGCEENQLVSKMLMGISSKKTKDKSEEKNASNPCENSKEKSVRSGKYKNIDENKRLEAERVKTENKLESLEQEIKDIEYAMTLCQHEYEKLNVLFQKKEELNRELEEAMEKWLKLSS